MKSFSSKYLFLAFVKLDSNKALYLLFYDIKYANPIEIIRNAIEILTAYKSLSIDLILR